VPILSDASVGDAVDVSSDEIDCLTLTLDLLRASREVTAKPQVRDDTITGYDHLLNLAAEVWNRNAHKPRGCQRPVNSLSTSDWQRIVDKIRRQRCAR